MMKRSIFVLIFPVIGKILLRSISFGNIAIVDVTNRTEVVCMIEP